MKLCYTLGTYLTILVHLQDADELSDHLNKKRSCITIKEVCLKKRAEKMQPKRQVASFFTLCTIVLSNIAEHIHDQS